MIGLYDKIKCIIKHSEIEFSYEYETNEFQTNYKVVEQSKTQKSGKDVKGTNRYITCINCINVYFYCLCTLSQCE